MIYSMNKNFKIEIVTSFYITKNNNRMNEIVKVLDKNLQNKYNRLFLHL